MVGKTTKYEQKRAARFTRRDNERRERLSCLSRYDPLYDMYEPLAHTLITLIDEFTRIDEDTIRAYLNKHKKENNMRERLKPNIGHDIRCVRYGGDPNDPADICIECEDCDEVLVSAETYIYEEGTYDD